MNKIALITGILGQDGPYLAKLLLSKKYRVIGMIRRYSKPNFDNLKYLGIDRDIELIEGDMTDEGSIMSIIKAYRPDEVYNLAAQSFVGSSWDQVKYTTETNSMGVLYLLNSLRFFAPGARFYQASTSELFGTNISSKGFQDETTPFHPRSPYAISKLYSYWMAVNYRESYHLFTTNGILFNHESPIRGMQFVTRKISYTVAQIYLKKANTLVLGNLDAKRDWGFAGDYVEAMYAMMQQDKPDDYVIATGISHSVRDFVKAAFEVVGIKNWDTYITTDPRFVRPAEVPVLQGNALKAKKILGWKPKVTFKKLVEMMVNEDIKRIKNSK